MANRYPNVNYKTFLKKEYSAKWSNNINFHTYGSCFKNLEHFLDFGDQFDLNSIHHNNKKQQVKTRAESGHSNLNTHNFLFVSILVEPSVLPWKTYGPHSWFFFSALTCVISSFEPWNAKTSQKISKWWEMTWLFLNCDK